MCLGVLSQSTYLLTGRTCGKSRVVSFVDEREHALGDTRYTQTRKMSLKVSFKVSPCLILDLLLGLRNHAWVPPIQFQRLELPRRNTQFEARLYGSSCSFNLVYAQKLVSQSVSLHRI